MILCRVKLWLIPSDIRNLLVTVLPRRRSDRHDRRLVQFVLGTEQAVIEWSNVAPSPATPSASRAYRSEEYMDKLLLTPEEAAEVLGVGRSRVYDLIRTRQLTSVRIGKSRRVPVTAVHAYVERLTEQDALA
jgi:excisionase family DNA binding protein